MRHPPTKRILDEFDNSSPLTRSKGQSCWPLHLSSRIDSSTGIGLFGALEQTRTELQTMAGIQNQGGIRLALFRVFRLNINRLGTHCILLATLSPVVRCRSHLFVGAAQAKVSWSFMGSPPPIQLATLSMWDTLILMALALVVFGPRRLPKIGRQLGKLMYEFRKASNDFKFQMEEELRASEEADRRKKEEETRQRAVAAAPASAQLEAPASQTPSPTPGTEKAGVPVLTEGPYSEGTDPNIEAKAQHVVEPATPADQPSEPVPGAAVPHIQPPSTGETVAAERPGSQFQQRELFSEDVSPTSESAAPEVERSEPAAHHG